jgi:hypothetical protein
MTTGEFASGGYRFIPAVFQYSSGVAALPGFEIHRVTFADLVPLAEGFRQAASIMGAAGRPLTAFCACELRSPAPVDEAGFRAFNQHYVETLEAWGIYDRKSNPVARSNTCPERDPPSQPCFTAFCFTMPSRRERPTFVIAGSGEARGGNGPYRERTVRHGETTPDALREKAVFVLNVMEDRLAAFGLSWRDTTATQVYTVHDLHPFLGNEIVRRGAARLGLTWHFNHPPVSDLCYEMDCRGIAVERVA